jgi:phosphoribosylanthranilate isomerase
MLVKICGITRLEDATAAVAAGAGAIGFIFWPGSARFIEPERAREIAGSLPAFVTPVGVFVNQPLDYVRDVAGDVGLGVIQLHGDESPDYAAGLATPVMKAIAVGAGETAATSWPENTTLLLDVYDPIKRGGTGQTIDWEAAAAIAQARRVLLAGGLTPENVADAIARVRPYGIDISSGVESAPGIKDHQRLRALFEALHGSDIPARS